MHKAQDGYQLTKGQLESYLWAFTDALMTMQDSKLNRLAGEIQAEFRGFEHRIEYRLKEIWSYIDVYKLP